MTEDEYVRTANHARFVTVAQILREIHPDDDDVVVFADIRRQIDAFAEKTLAKIKVTAQNSG